METLTNITLNLNPLYNGNGRVVGSTQGIPPDSSDNDTML